MATRVDRLDELSWCYLDRGLTPDEEAELIELLEDPECRQRWRFLMAFEGTLQEELEAAEIPVPRRTARIVGDIVKFMTPLALAAGFVFALFHFGLLGNRVIEGDVVAEVVAVSGEVVHESGAAEGGRSVLAVGDSVAPGDRVKTPESGEVQLVYRDKTALMLREGGELEFPELAPGEPGAKQLVLSGGVLKTAASRQHARTPMLLTTPHARCTVIGTEFMLMASPGLTRLDVKVGRISFEDLETGKTMIVSAGMCATADGKDAPVVAKSLGREFSPSYDGILFREVAQTYEKHGLFLDATKAGKAIRTWNAEQFIRAASKGTVDVRAGKLGKGKGATPACFLACSKEGSFEFELFDETPEAFVVEFGYMISAVTERGVTHTKMGIRGTDELKVENMPPQVKLFDKGTIQLQAGRWHNVEISCLLVGQLADGRPVYEQTLVWGDGKRNSHSLGAGQCNIFGVTISGGVAAIRNFRVREILMDRKMAANYFGRAPVE